MKHGPQHNNAAAHFNSAISMISQRSMTPGVISHAEVISHVMFSDPWDVQRPQR
jgi:hypothetical protein